jgi:DNA mismatch repair protein MLH3
VQFIALGIQPLLNEQHSNFFYEEVNRVFDNSSFGMIEETTLGDDGLPTKTEGFTGKELKPRRGIDRWPMFFLQIMLDTGTGSVDIGDFLDGRRQNHAVITDLLQVMAYEFLKKHHFRPKSVNALESLKRPRTSPPVPLSELPITSTSALSRGRSIPDAGRLSSKHEARKMTSSPRFNSQISSSEKRTASPFASWSRVKSSVTRGSGPKNKAVSPQSFQQAPGGLTVERYPTPDSSLETTPSSENPLFDKCGSLLRKPFDDGDEAFGTTPIEISSDQPSDAQSAARDETTGGTVVWVDPTTKIKSLIDSRTGFAVKSSSKAEIRPVPRPKKGDRARNVYQLGKWNTTQCGHKNAIFQPTELPVPQVIPVSETLGVEYDGRGGENQDAGGPNQNMSVALESRISKIALQKAQIFGQVDQKFILAKVVTAPSASFTSCVSEADRILILIDQHAADERCKVETLLEAYFVPDPAGSSRLVAQTQNLDKAIRVDLSRQDGNLLARYKKHFEHWGIEYEFLPDQETVPQGGGHKVTVEIQALPPSILERCRLEPRLLIDLLRKEIWKLDGLSSRRGGGCILLDANADHDWVAGFHDCPEGVLDLIHSRACRSESLFSLNVAPN